jgi:hypothetical protein
MPKNSTDPRKIQEIPDNESCVQFPLRLLTSDAWNSMPINCRRLIDFLLIEQCNHAGLENGNLVATYDQLDAYGIARRFIPKAISDAEKRGLIVAYRKGRISYNKSYENRYTLTFLKAKYKERNGGVYYSAPTNEWKKYRK